MEPTEEVLEEIAQSFACEYPYYVADQLETQDISLETIKDATKKVIGPLALSTFMMVATKEDPGKAHEWFMSVLTECAQTIQHAMSEQGMQTKFDISGAFIRKEEPESGSDESSRWG